MKASLVVNAYDNSISHSYPLICSRVMDNLKEYGVTIVNYLVTSTFDVDFERLIYSKDNDFLIVLGKNNCATKGTKKVFLLPDEPEETLNFVTSHIIPFVEQLTHSKYRTMFIKTFGISEKDVKLLIKDYLDDDNLLINIFADNLDVKTVIKYDSDLDRQVMQNLISGIYEKLRKFVYTDEDLSIYQLASNMLTVYNKQLSIAETITEGVITNNLLKLNDTTDRINQSIVTKNVKNIVKQLNLSEDPLINGNSVEIVYEMAAGLLETTGCDMAIATYGNVGDEYCYIAVGDIDGLHVYKNKCSGSHDKLVETLSKSAIFYLIKKIKQNDLFFNQIIV